MGFNQKGLAPIIIVLIVFVVAGLLGWGGMANKQKLVGCAVDVRACSDGSYTSRDPQNNCNWRPCPNDINGSGPKVCSADAKQCADGSYVSRNGSNCEFAACPSAKPALDLEKVSIDDAVTYEIPKGWRKVFTYPQTDDSDPKNRVYLVSPDLKLNDGPGLNSGALITIVKSKRDSDKTLQQIVVETHPVPGDQTQKEIDAIKKLTIAGEEGSNRLVCWEGCDDVYFFERDNYIWKIFFECADDCLSKDKTDKSRYAKDRDLILTTLRFR